MRRAIAVSPSAPCHTAYMLAITASSTCAVHTLLVAFSRRMCCSRVCSAMRSAGCPLASRLTPMMRPGQRALELVARGEERRVRSAVAERHAESLRVADADVGAPLARRREQRERQQVRRGDHQRARRVRALGRIAIVEHGAVGRRVLQQHAEHVGAERGRLGVADHASSMPARPRARLARRRSSADDSARRRRRCASRPCPRA